MVKGIKKIGLTGLLIMVCAVVSMAQEFTVEGTTLIDCSDIFVDGPSAPLSGAVGDASNDGTADIVVSRHKDFSLGKMAFFQNDGTGWDDGTVVITSPTKYNGIGEICLGDVVGDGAQWIVYRDHYQGNLYGELYVVKFNGITEVGRYHLKHVGWPGWIVPCVADTDGDGKNEVWAMTEEGNGKLYRFDYDAGLDDFTETPIITGVGTSSGHGQMVVPVAGDFANTGKDSILYCYATNSLHHHDGVTDTEILTLASGNFNYCGRAAGEFDGNPGTDLLFKDSNGNVYLLSGGSLTCTTVGTLAEPCCAMAGADLNNDGTDEAYLGLSNGDIYQYVDGRGLTFIESNSGITWWDGDKALFTGETLEQVSFVGEEAGNVTVRAFRCIGPDFNVQIAKIVDESNLFVESSEPVWSAAGDANNDGYMDLLISRHKDFSLGKLGIWTGSATAWDDGTLLHTSPSGYNGTGEICIGDVVSDGAQWIVYRDHMQYNDGAELYVVKYEGTTEVARYHLKHVSWPGWIVPCIADTDGDGQLEVWAMTEEGIGKLYRFDYDPDLDNFMETLIITGVGYSSGHGQMVVPVAGDFENTGRDSVLYCYSTSSLHLHDGVTDTVILTLSSGNFNYCGRAAGEFDGNPGTDLLFKDSNGNVYLLSGGSLTCTTVGTLAEPCCAMAPADLNGDGVDEVYIACNNGDLHQYTCAGGFEFLQNVDGIDWWDGDRAPWSGESRDHAAFVGEENGMVSAVTLYSQDGLNFYEDTGAIFESYGASVNLYLDAGTGCANRDYFIAGSITGTDPGMTLPGGEVLPIKKDVMTSLIFQLVNGPIFSDFYSQLDADGKGMATFNCPVLTPYSGFSVYFAYTTLYPFDYTSDAVEIIVLP